MFGIAQPCRHTLDPALKREWMGHLCGLCLGLRDHAGQAARVTTNVDAVVLSVLVAAQRSTDAETRRAGACPLRGMTTQVVPVSCDLGVQLAAAVSLTMAATKIDDHVLDHDGAWARLPFAPKAAARHWRNRGDGLAARVGLDVRAIEDAVARSNELEAGTAQGFAAHAAPTEDACALAFRHTAALAGRPDNGDALDDLGRAFGRLTYLLDAVEDHDDDVAHGRFNALAAIADPVERRAEARALFDDAHGRLGVAFSRLALERPALAEALLIEQVRRVGHRILQRLGHRHRHRHRRTAAGVGADAVRGLADLGVAGVAAFSVGAHVFKPGEGSIPGPSVPPPGTQPEGRQQRWLGNCCDLGGCCCCCDCCDGCDACDCCDCDC